MRRRETPDERDPGNRVIGLTETVGPQALITFAYSAVMIAWGNSSNPIVRHARDVCLKAAELPFRPIAWIVDGAAGCGGVTNGAGATLDMRLYSHLLGFCIVTAVICFWISRRHWNAWASRLRAARRWSNARPDVISREAQQGFALMALGTLPAIWFLFFDVGMFDSSSSCAVSNPWLLLRAPLLTMTAYNLTCAAAGFWAIRKL